MPVQQILIPCWAMGLWKQVQEGPVKMTEGCAKASADAKALQKKGLAIYENGALRLHKHCEEIPVVV